MQVTKVIALMEGELELLIFRFASHIGTTRIANHRDFSGEAFD
jgi:hypothetical protein